MALNSVGLADVSQAKEQLDKTQLAKNYLWMALLQSSKSKRLSAWYIFDIKRNMIVELKYNDTCTATFDSYWEMC